MQNTPGHGEACSTPCFFVCRIKTKLGDKTSRTYICIKENNIRHMMNNASHLRLPLFLWNFVVSPSGSGMTLWSAMIETNRLVLLNREAPVVPTDSARSDRIRNALTAWLYKLRSANTQTCYPGQGWIVRPIGGSPGVPDKSSRDLGSMCRYSAQIWICFIACIFQFIFYSFVGFGWELCRTAIVHCNQNEAGHQSKLPVCLPGIYATDWWNW